MYLIRYNKNIFNIIGEVLNMQNKINNNNVYSLPQYNIQDTINSGNPGTFPQSLPLTDWARLRLNNLLLQRFMPFHFGLLYPVSLLNPYNAFYNNPINYISGQNINRSNSSDQHRMCSKVADLSYLNNVNNTSQNVDGEKEENEKLITSPEDYEGFSEHKIYCNLDSLFYKGKYEDLRNIVKRFIDEDRFKTFVGEAVKPMFWACCYGNYESNEELNKDENYRKVVKFYANEVINNDKSKIVNGCCREIF